MQCFLCFKKHSPPRFKLFLIFYDTLWFINHYTWINFRQLLYSIMYVCKHFHCIAHYIVLVCNIYFIRAFIFSNFFIFLFAGLRTGALVNECEFNVFIRITYGKKEAEINFNNLRLQPRSWTVMKTARFSCCVKSP